MSLLGARGAPVNCRVITDDVSVHWWAEGAEPGDPCLCGKTKMREAS